MIQIAGWLGSLWGRVGVVAALLVAIVAWRANDVRVQQSKGAEGVKKSVAEQSENTREKANAARNAARKPGAVGRVRQTWCRDCDN